MDKYVMKSLRRFSAYRALIVNALYMVVLGFALCCGSNVFAAEIKECYANVDKDHGVMSDIQDAAINGNVFTSDFKDNKSLECVLKNIEGVKDDLCNAPKPQGKDVEACDTKVRNKASYVMYYYKRMNLKDVYGTKTGNGAWVWVTAGASRLADVLQSTFTGESFNDVKRSYQCAEAYEKYCADLEEKFEKDCRTIAQTVHKQMVECWICDVVQVVLDSMQLLTFKTTEKMVNAAYLLLGGMGLLWIAFKVTMLFAKMGSNAAEFFNEFLIRFTTILIAAAILQAPLVEFYRIAISPFILMTTALTEQVSAASVNDGERDFMSMVNQKLSIRPGDGQSCVQRYCKATPPSEADTDTSTLRVLDDDTINGLLCLTCRAYTQLVPFTAIGESLTCYANAQGVSILGIVRLPKFDFWLVGVMFILTFSILALLVATYVLGVILRLSFVVVLTPLFVTAWAFPISREYAIKGWNLFLFTMCEFLGIAVMMALFMTIMVNMFPGEPSTLLNYVAENNVEGVYRVITGLEPMGAAASVAADVTGGALLASAAAVSVGVTAGGAAVAAAGAVGSMGACLLLIVIFGVVMIGAKMLGSTEEMVSHLTGISTGISNIAFKEGGNLVKKTAAVAQSFFSGGAKGTTKAVKKGVSKVKEWKQKRDSKKASKKGKAPDSSSKGNSSSSGDKSSSGGSKPAKAPTPKIK